MNFTSRPSYPWRRSILPIELVAGWFPGPLRTVFENRKYLAPIGIRTQDRPAVILVALTSFYPVRRFLTSETFVLALAVCE